MESLLTLGRQTEAEGECWLLSEKLGRDGKEANYREQYKVSKVLFLGWERLGIIYRLKRRKNRKEGIEYLREKEKLESESWEERMEGFGGVIFKWEGHLTLLAWNEVKVWMSMFACKVMGFKMRDL